MNLSNERSSNESFDQYKKRRKLIKEYDKQFKKGRLFWDSSRLGEYRNPEKKPFCCLK